MGGCFLLVQNADQAHNHFVLARDLDTLRFRADTRVNEIIRAISVRHSGSGIMLLDAADLFARNSPQKLPGSELLLEHVHPNFHGNYLLARAMAEKLAPTITDQTRLTPAPVKPLLSEDECAERLALTAWDRLQIVEEMIRRLEQPPFTQQLGHKEMLAEWKRQREDLQNASRPESLEAQVAVYQRALQLRPNDWVLRENFARLLQ